MKNRYCYHLSLPIDRLYRRAYAVARVMERTRWLNTARRCEFVLVTLRGIIAQRLAQS